MVGPADDWRNATGVVLVESLAVKRIALGLALVEFDTHGSRWRPDATLTISADLLTPRLERTLDTALRRVLLIAVESADALGRLAFRLAPAGAEVIVGEPCEPLWA